jgi:hypothetical protein
MIRNVKYIAMVICSGWVNLLNGQRVFKNEELHMFVSINGNCPYYQFRMKHPDINNRPNLFFMPGLRIEYKRYSIGVQYQQLNIRKNYFYGAKKILEYDLPVMSQEAGARFHFIPIYVGFNIINHKAFKLRYQATRSFLNYKTKDYSFLTFTNDSILHGKVERDVTGFGRMDLVASWYNQKGVHSFLSISQMFIGMTSDTDKHGRVIRNYAFHNSVHLGGPYWVFAGGVELDIGNLHKTKVKKTSL